MTWQKLLEHRFVERIPRVLDQGVLYISMEYATAAHSCACGCGEEVMTPFTPTDWKMTFDGETVSLWPSVGNWQLACRSHYVIEKGRVIRARSWTQRQIASEQSRDKAAKARHYGRSNAMLPPSTSGPAPVAIDGSDEHTAAVDAAPAVQRRRGVWSSIIDRLSRLGAD
jgi:hypothetical protein